MTLADLTDGTHAILTGYDPAMAQSRRERLEDLGFILETRITRERTAPLGDPILYKVQGTTICLRHNEAKHIRIRRDPSNA